ncbi:hypothetical protein TNCV_3262261 [Trichonephila clavipes]|nr:hypothetical protein TNCV_3262261 [Trichonephila clavipes]
MTNLTRNQCGRKEQPVNKRKRSIGSKDSLVGLKKQQHNKTRQEVTGYKRRTPPSRSAGPEGKKTRKLGRKTHKRVLSSSSTSAKPLKKRVRDSKESLQQGRSSPYSLRPRSNVSKKAGPRLSGRAVQVQGGPVLSRREPFRRSSPCNQHRQSKQQYRKSQSKV